MMVSRKRNKGKERKAKQAEAKAEKNKVKIATLQSGECVLAENPILVVGCLVANILFAKLFQ